MVLLSFVYLVNQRKKGKVIIRGVPAVSMSMFLVSQQTHCFFCFYRDEAQASLGGGDPEGQDCQAELGVAGPEARTVQMPASILGYVLSLACHQKFCRSLANIGLHAGHCLFLPPAEDMTN